MRHLALKGSGIGALALISACAHSPVDPDRTGSNSWLALTEEERHAPVSPAGDRSAFLVHLDEERLRRESSARGLVWLARSAAASGALLMLSWMLYGDSDSAAEAVLTASLAGLGAEWARREAAKERECAAFLSTMGSAFASKWPPETLTPETFTVDPVRWREYRQDQDNIIHRGPC